MNMFNSLRPSDAYICVDELVIIGSNNGLSPDRWQAIIWTNAGLLSIEPLWTYFNENLIKIQQFSLKKMHVKMSSAKWHPSCLGLNVLKTGCQDNLCLVDIDMPYWANGYVSLLCFPPITDTLQGIYMQSPLTDVDLQGTWWRNAVETLSTLLVHCEGNPVDSPHNGTSNVEL